MRVWPGAWPHNLHAIALTLQRLRLADLYGVTRRGEQYAGWKMLPGPITAGADAAPAMNLDDAAKFIAKHSSFDAVSVVHSRLKWELAYREAVKNLHPDVNAGASQDNWERLQQAATLFNSLHNRK